MNEIAEWLFEPSGLTPHGFCLLWEPGLIWLHAAADVGIGLAYFTIPVILYAIMRRRPDLLFRPLMGLFAAFILLCGTGHWLDLLTLWVPAYGAEGAVKALTAVASITTAAVLWTLMPKMLVFPSPLQMRQAHDDLQRLQIAEQHLVTVAKETAEVRDALAVELARRKTIEAALREIIIEAAPNGLMTIDESGIITLANSAAERTFDYAPGRLVGRAITTLLPGGFPLPPAASPGAPLNALNPADQHQTTGILRDGTAITVELQLSPVKTPGGAIMVVSLADVTRRLQQEAERLEAERKERQAIENTNANLDRLAQDLTKARDRAEQANRAKSLFLAGMSHELRTPLNAILGYAHLLEMDGGFTPTQSARLTSMLSASRHLLEMITCVLDLSEIEAEHVTLRPADVDVRAVGEACVDLLRPAAEAKQLSLTLTVMPGTQRFVFVDPTRLRQVLVNLLGNAVKFTEKGGVEVRLHSGRNGVALQVDVVDTGPGIPPELEGWLFRDFERLGISSKVEGAGLGLALSYRLAKLLGGQLTYASNPNGGSMFCLELPRRDLAAEPAQAVSANAPEASLPAGMLRVLVVDDVHTNCDIASNFLRAAGHKVTCVEDGAAAIEAAAALDFDVILMDVRMPGMDGLEATRRIRALHGARARVAIVGLTAYAFTEQVIQCQEAGMDGYVTKPFEPETLIATVTRTAAQAKPTVS